MQIPVNTKNHSSDILARKRKRPIPWRRTGRFISYV